MYKSKFDPYEKGYYGEDLRPKILLKNVTCESIDVSLSHSNLTPEIAQKIAENQKKMEILKTTSVNEKPNFYDNLQMIPTAIIEDMPEGWNLFDTPSDAELMDLMRSIESVGLINPIHVMHTSSGTYCVIIGRFRHLAYTNLLNITKNTLYEKIPAYVINQDDVDELYIRNMIFESNFKFRSISKFNLIQTMIQNYNLMRRTKKYRRQLNVAMELSKQFEVSESTVFDYLKVRKLCDTGLYHLYNGNITLKAAVYLTRVPKELQEEIIKEFGVESVNAIFKLKLLVANEKISLEKLKKQIGVVNDLVPEKTRITIEVQRELLSALIELLLQFKRFEAASCAGKMGGKFSKVFNFKCNNEDMKYYLEKGLINKVSLKKLLAQSLTEMVNIK
ncbi:MAG: ParB/RepB/Spo0J family partition protein [Oscillospiraceae bacterium]|nr:ParB/RepB/Spo0J family partition protein [Oscillospiraceae bacterium]